MTEPGTTPRLPTGVGWTSLLTAYARAQESERADRMFVDPWAGPLVAAAAGRSGDGGALPRLGPARDDRSSRLWSMFAAYFAGRTPFFDTPVLTGVADGAGQVVVLAAGLDARAARLDLPAGVPVFEVDSAEVLAFKAEVLDREGLDVPARVPVVADLAGDWTPALSAAGFDPQVPTVWLIEGLLMYLDAEDCDRLLTTVREHSAAGSRVAVEYFERNPTEDDVTLVDDQERAITDLLFASFAAGPGRPPQVWLTQQGLTVERVTDIAEEIRAQGRPVPPELDPAPLADPFRIWLAAASADRSSGNRSVVTSVG